MIRGIGGFRRRLPRSGSANRIPLNASTPVSEFPTTVPSLIVTVGAGEAARSSVSALVGCPLLAAKVASAGPKAGVPGKGSLYSTNGPYGCSKVCSMGDEKGKVKED